jgi:hypothetical protein
MKTSLKIYNPNWSVDVARDWNLEATEANLETVLAQPYRIACVPTCFTNPYNFTYNNYQQANVRLDLSKFDLVIMSDIEQERDSAIQHWIRSNNIKNYISAVGAIHNAESINNETTVLRSWWMYNLMRMNSFDEHMQPTKPYWFDVLLGARRPHRDFAMLSFQQTEIV